MEALDHAEVFDHQDDIFSYTEVILKNGRNHYRAITDRRFNNTSEIELPTFDLQLIALPHTQPTFPSNPTPVPEPPPTNTYIKRPSLYFSSPSTKAIVLHEAQICEKLKEFPILKISAQEEL